MVHAYITVDAIHASARKIQGKKSEIGSQPTTCQVHTGTYVSIPAPERDEGRETPSKKTLREWASLRLGEVERPLIFRIPLPFRALYFGIGLLFLSFFWVGSHPIDVSRIISIPNKSHSFRFILARFCSVRFGSVRNGSGRLGTVRFDFGRTLSDRLHSVPFGSV